jgi:hypothetical protein
MGKPTFDTRVQGSGSFRNQKSMFLMPDAWFLISGIKRRYETSESNRRF